MRGLDRYIDPVTRDYVADGKGSATKTRSASTRVYLAIQGQLNRWWGDSEAGSLLYRFDRANNDLATLREIQATLEAALRPLVELQLIGDLSITIEQESRHRSTLRTSMRDLRTGETIDATPMAPFTG